MTTCPCGEASGRCRPRIASKPTAVRCGAVLTTPSSVPWTGREHPAALTAMSPPTFGYPLRQKAALTCDVTCNGRLHGLPTLCEQRLSKIDHGEQCRQRISLISVICRIAKYYNLITTACPARLSNSTDVGSRQVENRTAAQGRPERTGYESPARPINRWSKDSR